MSTNKKGNKKGKGGEDKKENIADISKYLER